MIDGGNGQYLNVDPYFDDLFCMAADRRFMSVEKIVDTDDLAAGGPVQTLKINRLMTDGVVEAPHGAHFTECVPDYPRDEEFQRAYAASAKTPEAWSEWRAKYLDCGDHNEYRKVVGRLMSEATGDLITRAEYCVIAVAECFRGDGEILANPIGTVPMIGGRLAARELLARSRDDRR